jgi:hypothetical protein
VLPPSERYSHHCTDARREQERRPNAYLQTALRQVLYRRTNDEPWHQDTGETGHAVVDESRPAVSAEGEKYRHDADERRRVSIRRYGRLRDGPKSRLGWENRQREYRATRCGQRSQPTDQAPIL